MGCFYPSQLLSTLSCPPCALMDRRMSFPIEKSLKKCPEHLHGLWPIGCSRVLISIKYYDLVRRWVQLSLKVPARGTGVLCFGEPAALPVFSAPASWRKGTWERSHLPAVCHGSAHGEPQLCHRGEVPLCAGVTLPGLGQWWELLLCNCRKDLTFPDSHKDQ